MKKTIAGAVVMVMVLALFCTNAFADRTGLNGVFLFLGLQVNPANGTKNFYDIVDFDEALRQSSLPRAGGRRICENRIGGVDYLFWIETGQAPRREKNFLLTFKQVRSKADMDDGIVNISVEKVHGRDETNLLVFNGGAPKFHMSVYGAYDREIFFGQADNRPSNNRRIEQYTKLDCRYTYQK